MASEANRDEVMKCRAIAKKALQAGDKDKAVRFLNKAVRMAGPDDKIVRLTKLQVIIQNNSYCLNLI